ncbi:MAG: iron ABC transporter substrate-binding protein [Kiritimatiellae bacterium]|nr:iron ABC transporter substrate-binding protein [Kiritimatiellia bacterium]
MQSLNWRKHGDAGVAAHRAARYAARTGPRPARRLVAASVLAVVLTAARPSARGAEETRTVTDLAGRRVTVPGRVERLVALGPGCLRLVAYLGAVDKVVGMEEMERRIDKAWYFRPYAAALPNAYFELPVVGPGGPGKLPDFERVMLCRADVIFVVSIDPTQIQNIQAKTGIPTVCLSYGELGVWREAARESLVLLGKILDREDRAKAVNAYVSTLEEDLTHRTRDAGAAGGPGTYFGGISFKGAHGLTSTQGGYPPARMAGARNVADAPGKEGHLFVDKEQIMLWNPDTIFVDIGSKAVLEQDFEKDRAFYRLLNATRTGRVFSLLPYNYYNTNIEIAILNAYFIGKCLYPDRFNDVTMRTKADEILGTFLGICAEGEMPAYGVVTFPATGPVQWRAP